MLYLILSCTLAERWKSSDAVDALAPVLTKMVKSSPDQLTRDAVLSLTVKGIINAVFVRLEKAFGFTLVDHIIGFLTFSKFGKAPAFDASSC